MNRPDEIRARLEAALPGAEVAVVDDSHLHAGHAGARAGGGHYRVRVVSPAFAGKRMIQRHRMVYEAVGDMMRPDCVHALNIQAFTPDEL